MATRKASEVGGGEEKKREPTAINPTKLSKPPISNHVDDRGSTGLMSLPTNHSAPFVNIGSNTINTRYSKMAVARNDLGIVARNKASRAREIRTVFAYGNRVQSCLKIVLFLVVTRNLRGSELEVT